MSATRVMRLPRRMLGIAAFTATLIAILMLAWFAYRPGLSGAFLFDDLGSLPKLGATGPVDNWATFWRYITSGTADPTGRPLALLSFLIDARDWPVNPYPFKVTNVILHLINGALLAWVLWKLGQALFPSLLRGVGGRSSAQHLGKDSTSRDMPGLCKAESSPGVTCHHHGTLRHGWRTYPWREGSQTGFLAFDNRGIAIAALFGAGAWLLHPLFVSTTLYIVQREAMLPATFTLIGILGWMASRGALIRGSVKRALSGFALSAWLCTFLAVASKANGVLLPLLLLLIEWIALTPCCPMPSVQADRWRKRAILAFLVTPCVLLVIYLLWLLSNAIHTAPGIRGWTVGQRLLTEPRVLTDYLRLLFMPHAHSSGLFNDAFPVSTNWLSPKSTIPCLVLTLALISAGFALRKKCPAIALALLFYFTAQLLESGWIPLELYFEHRNYLPAMLLFWPIGLALGKPGALRFLRTAAATAILFILAMLTVQRTILWGNAPQQAQVWAAINQNSARAQTSAALYDLQSGRPRLAAARLRLALPEHPDDLQIPVNLITAECRLGAVQVNTLVTARAALANDRVGGQVAFNWFNEALASIKKKSCRNLDYTTLRGMLNAASRNPYWRKHSGLQANLMHMRGTLELARQDPQKALRDFDLALMQTPNADIALNQASTLASAGYPTLGLQHLDYFETLKPQRRTGLGMPRVHAWVLTRQEYWRHEIEHLRTEIEAAAVTGNPADHSMP